MSSNRSKNTEMRRSPVSHNSTKPAKSKTPKSKVSKTPGRPLSNGVHEVHSNGVGKKKVEQEKDKDGEKATAKINLMTLQKVDSGVSSILATIPHVVLYEFKTAENVWVSGGVQGVQDV